MTTVIVLTFATVVPLVILRLLRIRDGRWTDGPLTRGEGRNEEWVEQRSGDVDEGTPPDWDDSRGSSGILDFLEDLLDLLIPDNPRPLMQVLVTLIGILGGGYVVISGGYSGDIENWAAGIVGLVIGYWLK